MSLGLFDGDPAFLALLLGALLLGGFVKGVVGIGLPLVTIPMLALKLPPAQAIAVMMIPIVASNLWQVATCGDYRVTLRRFWPVTVVLIVTSALGVLILVSINAESARTALGLIVVAVVSLQTLVGGRFSLPAVYERPVGLAAGAVSGVVGGMSNAFGPPLVIYLMALRLKPGDFLSATGFLFLAGGAPLYGGLILAGEFGQRELILSLLACLPVAAGMALGGRVRGYLPEKQFRRAVTAVLILVGLSLVLR